MNVIKVRAKGPRHVFGFIQSIMLLLALQMVSMSSLAQTCGIDNWSHATNLDNTYTGVQGPSNRRYGGPCAIRIALDGTARFLTDESPLNESTMIVRFYVFLDEVTATNPVWIYSADDGLEDRIEVWYNVPTSGDLSLTVRDSADDLHDLSFSDIPSGWHSVEFVWEASAAEDNIRFALNSDDPAEDLVATVDTSGLGIVNASLGNLNGASGGSVDFDDYASRRISRPGRLLVADADDDQQINIADIIAIADELDELGFAPGQPDCDEDGSIDPLDATCIIDILDNQ